MDIVTETPQFNCVASLVIVSLMFNGMIAEPLNAQEAEKYEIVIVSGANLVNSVKRRVATEPIVEVQDRNKKPVGGVILTFTLPQTGPGGTFTATGSNIATVTTDASGRATMPLFQSNDQAGSFNVTVSGSVNGTPVSATILVTNKAAAGIGHSTALTVAIFVAAAAGIAGGIAAGRSGSSKTTVTPGTPSIGPAGAGPRR